MPTPMQKFFEVLDSGSKSAYKGNLEAFFAWIKIDPDDFVKFDSKKIADLVFDYIIHLKMRSEQGNLNPNSIPTKFYPIQLFCEQNDILLNWKKIHRLFPRKKVLSNQGAYTNEEIQRMLNYTNSPRNKAWIHFLQSTGVRVGAIPDLKIKDVRPIENGAVVDVYVDDIEEYRTCLTPEAYKSLKEYFEWRNYCGYPVTQDSPLFTNKRGSEPITYNMAKDLMRIIVSGAGLRPARNIERTKKNKSPNHAFRKRFEIVLTNSGVHSKYTAFMMGHYERNTDKNYFRDMSDSDLYKQFKMAIPLLTIDKTDELIKENERLEKKNKEEIDEVKEQLHKTRIETLKLITDLVNNPSLLKKLKEQLQD